MSDMRNMHSNMTGPAVCAGCNKPIYDGTVCKVNDRFWHNLCLRCVACNSNVTEYCHIKGNEVFCRNDFTRLFGTKCASCHKVVSPVEAASLVNGHVYHTSCVRCVTCHSEIDTGTCFYMREDLKLICQRDYNRLQNQTASHQSESESDESGSDETFEHQPACLSFEQLRMLDDLYTVRKRPTRSERADLCERTGLTGRQVQLWFKNRRSKDKRKSCLSTTNPIQQNEIHFSNPSWTATSKTNHPPSGTLPSTNFQLYCPLDFLDPDSMPPNMELDPADFCNGEVIAGKQNNRPEMKEMPSHSGSHVTSGHFVTNNILSNWLAV